MHNKVAMDILIIKEIKEAVIALGYNDIIRVKKQSHDRFMVYVGKEQLGVYDLNKHTFVD